MSIVSTISLRDFLTKPRNADARNFFSDTPLTPQDINRAATELSNWYLRKGVSVEEEAIPSLFSPVVTPPKEMQEALSRANATFQAYGEDLARIHSLFTTLDDFEKEVIYELRDLGVSIPDLVDYLRSPEDLNPEGTPIRSDVASKLRLREFEEKSKSMRSTGRAAAVLGGSALILTVGAIVAAPVVLPVIAPSIAPTVITALAPVMAFIPSVKAGAVGLMQFAAGGGAVAVMIKAWENWQKIRGGPPALEIGSTKDFDDLPGSLGNLDYKRLTDEYQAIPGADRYLLSHLSKSEMRLFLSGSDSVRKHILTASPPAAWAKIQSRLDGLAHSKKQGLGARAKRVGQVAHALLTASWDREIGNGRVPDLEKRMASWRSAAQINHISRREDLSPQSIQIEGSEVIMIGNDIVVPIGPRSRDPNSLSQPFSRFHDYPVVSYNPQDVVDNLNTHRKTEVRVSSFSEGEVGKEYNVLDISITPKSRTRRRS